MSKERALNILQVIGCLNPALGGQPESLRQWTLALTELEYGSDVVTLDAPEAPWVSQFPGTVHALGPSLGKYRFNRRLIPWLKANAARYDAVIVRGIWQYQSFGVWRAARALGFPYFVFVHGALDPWFKQAFRLKHLKKWLYWPWAEYRVLRDASAVFFTTEDERSLARESFWLYQANEVVIDYGIRAPRGDPRVQRDMFLNSYPELRDKRILMFLSRIHKKKGCDLLIKALGKVVAQDPQLHLVIAGPDQEGLQGGLMALARQLGISERITWTGMLVGDKKWGAFHAAGAFVLPSHSENFGMVLTEALACGLPVLTTYKVNIWREIETDRAGFIEADTETGTVNLLQRWLDLSEAERQIMSQRARACFANRFEIHEAARMLVRVIEQHVCRPKANSA